MIVEKTVHRVNADCKCRKLETMKKINRLILQINDLSVLPLK